MISLYVNTIDLPIFSPILSKRQNSIDLAIISLILAKRQHELRDNKECLLLIELCSLGETRFSDVMMY